MGMIGSLRSVRVLAHARDEMGETPDAGGETYELMNSGCAARARAFSQAGCAPRKQQERRGYGARVPAPVTGGPPQMHGGVGRI